MPHGGKKHRRDRSVGLVVWAPKYGGKQLVSKRHFADVYSFLREDT
jgi:hypothetical protein